MTHFSAFPFVVVTRLLSRVAELFSGADLPELDPNSPAARELAYDAYIRNNV